MSDTEAPEVTFVGGKAVEQTEGLDSNLETDEREAAKEAVRKAIKDAGEESAKNAKEDRGKDPFKPAGLKKESSTPKKEPEADESSEAPVRGPDGKFLPRTGKAASPAEKSEKEEPELDVEKSSVKEILKNRERVAAMKKRAADDISQERRTFESEREAHRQREYAYQQQVAEFNRKQQSWSALQKDPARAVREAGYDPEQFILDLASEGTPEGKAQRELRELRQQVQEMNQWRQNQARASQEAQQRQAEHQKNQFRAKVVNDFLDLAGDENKYPHVSAFYKGQDRALVAFGDLAAEEYRSLSGKDGELADILDYIEDQLADRANTWYSKKSGAEKEKPAHKDTVEEKPKSKGKSLSPDASSERRTLTAKSLKDLDGDERLEAAKQAVAVALANSKD